MSEWDSVISVLGTLGGTALGLLIGYWTSSHIEAKQEEHAAEMEYRRELSKNMNDIIKPLFGYVVNLSASLNLLELQLTTLIFVSTATTLQQNIKAVDEEKKKLHEFYVSKWQEINFLFPNELDIWVLHIIEIRIDETLAEILKGTALPDYGFTQVINALEKYENNLKKLIGYETKVKLERIYPFPSKKSAISKIQLLKID